MFLEPVAHELRVDAIDVDPDAPPQVLQERVEPAQQVGQLLDEDGDLAPENGQHEQDEGHQHQPDGHDGEPGRQGSRQAQGGEPVGDGAADVGEHRADDERREHRQQGVEEQREERRTSTPQPKFCTGRGCAVHAVSYNFASFAMCEGSVETTAL